MPHDAFKVQGHNDVFKAQGPTVDPVTQRPKGSEHVPPPSVRSPVDALRSGFDGSALPEYPLLNVPNHPASVKEHVNPWKGKPAVKEDHESFTDLHKRVVSELVADAKKDYTKNGNFREIKKAETEYRARMEEHYKEEMRPKNFKEKFLNFFGIYSDRQQDRKDFWEKEPGEKDSVEGKLRNAGYDKLNREKMSDEYKQRLEPYTKTSEAIEELWDKNDPVYQRYQDFMAVAGKAATQYGSKELEKSEGMKLISELMEKLRKDSGKSPFEKLSPEEKKEALADMLSNPAELVDAFRKIEGSYPGHEMYLPEDLPPYSAKKLLSHLIQLSEKDIEKFAKEQEGPHPQLTERTNKLGEVATKSEIEKFVEQVNKLSGTTFSLEQMLSNPILVQDAVKKIKDRYSPRGHEMFRNFELESKLSKGEDLANYFMRLIGQDKKEIVKEMQS